MLTSTSSRHCTRSWRSLQASWSLAVRSQSTSATEQESTTSIASNRHTTGNELLPSIQALSPIRRLSRKKELSLARAISLYHHSLTFPDFKPETAANTLKSRATQPATPPEIDDYIYNKLHHEPLKPLTFDKPRSIPATPLSQDDPYAYMDKAKRATLSLAPSKKGTDAIQEEEKEFPSHPKKWAALSSRSSRESRTRARKMLDALLGTVDARKPGLRMIQAVCQMNRESAAERQGRQKNSLDK